MAEAQESEGSDVKSAQDVLKMSGNDELKFGVLIGLIKVGQVSNKDVVDTVLNLVSGYSCHTYYEFPVIVLLYLFEPLRVRFCKQNGVGGVITYLVVALTSDMSTGRQCDLHNWRSADQSSTQ